MFNETDLIKDGLARQQDLLAIARNRQLRWANITAHPKAVQLHLEIADLFRQSIGKYNMLLDIYQNRDE